MTLTWALISSPSGRRTRSGGSSFITRRPSTTLVSLDRACRLSRPRAFRTVLLNFLAVVFLALASESRPRISSSPTREYQTSSSPISENSAIRCRYEATDARAASRQSGASKPLSRPATTKLAARRFTSHSQGPGRVSSKSLRSKSRARSGEAYAPKFKRWASQTSVSGLARLPWLLLHNAGILRHLCGDRLVSGAQGGRSSSRRFPAPLRFVAGHRSAPRSIGLFERRAVHPGAGRLPAPVTTLRSERPLALPRSAEFYLRLLSYRPLFATLRQTPGGPPRSRKASTGPRAGRQGLPETRQRPRAARPRGAESEPRATTPRAGCRSPQLRGRARASAGGQRPSGRGLAPPSRWWLPSPCRCRRRRRVPLCRWCPRGRRAGPSGVVPILPGGSPGCWRCRPRRAAPSVRRSPCLPPLDLSPSWRPG